MTYVGTPSSYGNNTYTLASILQGESSSPQGWQAIGNVLTNRAAANYGGYGSDILSQALAPNQFQGQSTPSSGAIAAAQGILSGNNPNVVGNAMFYAAPGSTAQWAVNALGLGKGITIGGNTFFADTSGATPTGAPSSLPGPLGGMTGPKITMMDGGSTPGGGTGAQSGGGTGAQPGGGTGAQAGGNTGPGAPIVITDITNAGVVGAGQIKAGLGQVQSGLKTTASSITSSEQAAAQTATGITNTGLAAVADWFVRGAVGLLGILLLVLGLWLMGSARHAEG